MRILRFEAAADSIWRRIVARLLHQSALGHVSGSLNSFTDNFKRVGGHYAANRHNDTRTQTENPRERIRRGALSRARRRSDDSLS